MDRQNINIKQLELEYITPNIYEDDDRSVMLKNIVASLDEVDKRVLLLYTELGSVRKLGEILNVSSSTAYNKIKAIKKKLKKKL